jgi:hypothetical protein
MGRIQKPPIGKWDINELVEDAKKREADLKREIKSLKHQQLTELKKLKIKSMMDGYKNLPTSSLNQNPRHYDPLTFKDRESKSELYTSGSLNVNNIEPILTTQPEQLKHVVPSGGKKHKIEVEEISHSIAPKRKSIIELVFDAVMDVFKKYTRTLGPK